MAPHKQKLKFEKKVINIKEKFGKFDDLWSPKIISVMNDYEFKLVKVKDDFVWHKHDETDEVFIVMEGRLFIEFEEETAELNAGEMIVVPKRGKTPSVRQKTLQKLCLLKKVALLILGTIHLISQQAIKIGYNLSMRGVGIGFAYLMVYPHPSKSLLFYGVLGLFLPQITHFLDFLAKNFYMKTF